MLENTSRQKKTIKDIKWKLFIGELRTDFAQEKLKQSSKHLYIEYLSFVHKLADPNQHTQPNARNVLNQQIK
jgi:hypothetical protein